MKTHKRSLWLALLLVGIIIFDSSIYSHANATHSEKSYDMLSILFHVPYLDAAGIEIYYQSERQELIQEMNELLATQPVHVTRRGVFSSYYAVTRDESSEYFYYGATKDNRPDGLGILTTGKVSMEDSTTFSHLVYAGGFSKGTYCGYGVTFANIPDKNKLPPSSLQTLVDREIISKEIIPALIIYCSSYVVRESTWKDGYSTGKTNKFNDVRIASTPQSDYWGVCYYPNILTVSAAKKDNLSGDAKYYVNGVLRYAGEMKNGYENGAGTSYFENGKIEYTGKWRFGYYHGEGTLYSEDGKIVYKGKWKRGDYAS